VHLPLGLSGQNERYAVRGGASVRERREVCDGVRCSPQSVECQRLGAGRGRNRRVIGPLAPGGPPWRSGTQGMLVSAHRALCLRHPAASRLLPLPRAEPAPHAVPLPRASLGALSAHWAGRTDCLGHLLQLEPRARVMVWEEQVALAIARRPSVPGWALQEAFDGVDIDAARGDDAGAVERLVGRDTPWYRWLRP